MHAEFTKVIVAIVHGNCCAPSADGKDGAEHVLNGGFLHQDYHHHYDKLVESERLGAYLLNGS